MRETLFCNERFETMRIFHSETVEENKSFASYVLFWTEPDLYPPDLICSVYLLPIILFGEENGTLNIKINYVRIVLSISSMFNLSSSSLNQLHLHCSCYVILYCSELCELLFTVDFHLILYCGFPSRKGYWTWRKPSGRIYALIFVIVCKYPHALMTVFHYTLSLKRPCLPAHIRLSEVSEKSLQYMITRRCGMKRNQDTIHFLAYALNLPS
jgi:hypothetical protein